MDGGIPGLISDWWDKASNYITPGGPAVATFAALDR